MPEVIVLCYHAVSPKWDAPLSSSPAALERHLAWLTDHGWRGTTFKKAVLDPPAERTVAITFDDAFASVAKVAFPILSSAGFPGTVFAPTAFMSERRPLRWQGLERWLNGSFAQELEPMSWEDLGRLADHGWEIGSHTRSHPHLTRLAQPTLVEELRGSRDEISTCLGLPCESIAYPYGDVDARVAEAAAMAGYRAGGALAHRMGGSSPHRWPRIGVYHVDDHPWRFRLKVSGLTRRVRASPLWPS